MTPWCARLAVFVCILLSASSAFSQEQPIQIALDWNKVAAVSKANVSIEVCVEPPLRRGYPIHDQLFDALHNLGAAVAVVTLPE